MTFVEAAIIANDGKKIRRHNWKGYWYLKEGRMFNKYWVIRLANGKEISKGFNNATIFNCLANDWEIVDESEVEEIAREQAEIAKAIEAAGK